MKLRASTALLVAVLLMTLAFLPAEARAPSVSQVGPPTVSSVQLAWLRPASPNADGLYFDLIVAANVTATGAGVIRVGASLRTGNGTVYIVSNDTWSPFDDSSGKATFYAHLPGPLIRLAGFDGPYLLNLFAQAWSSDGVTPGNDVNIWTLTPAFTAASFAPPWADAVGPITYSTPDADHDGLTDALIAHVPIAVTAAGPVDVWGSLSALNSNGYNGFASAGNDASRFLARGTYTWDLSFPGYSIRQHGLDGPYLLTIFLRFPFLNPGNGGPTLSRAFTTPAYTSSRFEAAVVTLRAPITATLAPNGFTLNALEVLHVPLHIGAAGNYTVEAMPQVPYLSPFHVVSYPTTEALRDVSLPAGDTTVDLTFSSLVLTRWPSGQNSTFVISASPIDAPYADGMSTSWTERNVTLSALPTRPVAWVSVNATYAGEPCSWLSGAAADLSDHFFYSGLGGGRLGAPATLTFELYPGTFELYLSGCGTSSVQTLTVPRTESLNVTLPAPPTLPPDQYTMTFPSWNDAVATYATSQLGTGGARFAADLAGNWDGTASNAELAVYLQTLVWNFIPALLTMDGSDYFYPTWTLTGVQGAGPVLSAGPVTASVRYEERLPVPMSPSARHTITLHMYYVANGFLPYQVDLHLPQGVTGSLAVTATASAWSNVTAPANVIVQTLGAGAWRLTPGAPPSGYNFSWAVATVAIGGSGATPGSGGGAVAGLETSLPSILMAVTAGVVALVAIVVVVRRPRRAKP